MVEAAAEGRAAPAAATRKATWRVLPSLMLCCSVAFGLGGGLFDVGYVLCEVPSNLATGGSRGDKCC